MSIDISIFLDSNIQFNWLNEGNSYSLGSSSLTFYDSVKRSTKSINVKISHINIIEKVKGFARNKDKKVTLKDLNAEDFNDAFNDFMNSDFINTALSLGSKITFIDLFSENPTASEFNIEPMLKDHRNFIYNHAKAIGSISEIFLDLNIEGKKLGEYKRGQFKSLIESKFPQIDSNLTSEELEIQKCIYANNFYTKDLLLDNPDLLLEISNQGMPITLHDVGGFIHFLVHVFMSEKEKKINQKDMENILCDYLLLRTAQVYNGMLFTFDEGLYYRSVQHLYLESLRSSHEAQDESESIGFCDIRFINQKNIFGNLRNGNLNIVRVSSGLYDYGKNLNREKLKFK
ncbi:hypothetical protein [Vibrio owensii]|uniref:hypothetical protein n=1 Tax=Vibrio owensii TaxID=696485 RepID=UPI003CC65117